MVYGPCKTNRFKSCIIVMYALLLEIVMFIIILLAILAVVIIGVCSFVSFRQQDRYSHFTHPIDENWDWDHDCWFPSVSRMHIVRYHAWRIMTHSGQRPFFTIVKIDRNSRSERCGDVWCHNKGSALVWRIPLIGLLVCVERLGTSKLPSGVGIYRPLKHSSVWNVNFENVHYRYYIGMALETNNA